MMGLYTLTFTLMLSSLPCLHTFWHVIPTSCYIFFCFLFLFNEKRCHFGNCKYRHVCRMCEGTHAALDCPGQGGQSGNAGPGPIRRENPPRYHGNGYPTEGQAAGSEQTVMRDCYRFSFRLICIHVHNDNGAEPNNLIKFQIRHMVLLGLHSGTNTWGQGREVASFPGLRERSPVGASVIWAGRHPVTWSSIYISK